MRLAPTLLLATLTFTTTAQQPAQQSAAPAKSPSAAPPGATVLRTGTQLVIVDVVVQDHDGRPVHGLKREDFTLTDGKNPESIRSFAEHSSDLGPNAPKPGPSIGTMPPGTFTNYTPVAPNETLNILLLDALNTPMSDQAYVRYQLQQYVKKAKPGTRIAIFGLGTRLYLLQGFTSDPEILKGAVEHKLLPRASQILDDPAGTGVDTPSLSNAALDAGAPAAIASNLQQFEAETASFQTQLRTQYTLDAFNQLGRYLSNFQGRKNLIWFSGAFPLSIFPDTDLSDPFAVMADSSDEFRETTNLLSRAQVAVYPVDARGLQTDPSFSAASSGRNNIRNPGADTRKFLQARAQEHMTMEEMASATGGHAFYNTNDLATAVTKSIESGSNYYTLEYTPTNHDWNGSFRRIKVIVNEARTGGKPKLAYRDGYYADDPNARPKDKKAPVSGVTTEQAVAASRSQVAYARNAMSHGSPQPEDILFKVRVLPAATTTEDTLAPGNQPDPAKPIKGPFRRYVVDLVALANSFKLTAQPDGKHTGAIEFTAYVFDNDGKLLNAIGDTVQLNLSPETYTTFRTSPVNFRLEVSAPAKGETFLRIGIHDVPSNRFGAVEIPVSSVAHLPPPPPPPTPPTSTAPAPAATPAPPK